MTEEQLSALLRLKRYEQPPEGYFDKLLQDIHRNQRTELLRRPLWRIALDRVQTFFGEHSMGSASYAGAMATVLIVGVAGIRLMTPVGSSGQHGPVVDNGRQTQTVFATPEKLLTLQEPTPTPRLDSVRSFPVSQPSFESQPPRYVIDARPVSYEPSSSFKF
jgi:hypothetical protein